MTPRPYVLSVLLKAYAKVNLFNSANIYLFNVNNRNTRKRSEICSKNKCNNKNTRTKSMLLVSYSLTKLSSNDIFFSFFLIFAPLELIPFEGPQ